MEKTDRGFLSFFPEAMERRAYKAPWTECRTQSGSVVPSLASQCSSQLLNVAESDSQTTENEFITKYC